ncbi:MAG: hypothetical protein NTU51_02915 [Bacteroidetes bacterium]|nr:hypothetical protein [Bacteroidota bacterium]
MKSKGRLYRNFFITGLIFLLIAGLVYRYVPFRKIIRIPGSRELSFSKPVENGSGAPNSIAFDFEVERGKEVPNGILMGNAHSGNYAAKAFGKNSFTPAMERLAGELGTGKLKYISVSAWVFVKPGVDPVNTALVLAASNEVGVNICWKGIGLKDPLVPRGKWFKMSGQFDLSEVKFSNDTRLQMYFWNNSNTDILIDDYYMVYGGPQARRGDTTYVDLTKGPYQPRFNYPPFPVCCLRMSTIGGMEGINLILPSDPMISGMFLAGNGGKDVLFVIPPSGKPAIYSYCSEANMFRRSLVEFPMALPQPGFGKQYLLKGKFISGECEQLLYISEKICMVCKFNCKGGTCKEENTAGAELLWHSEKFENIVFNFDNPILASDFDGDGVTELLSVNDNGTWKLMKFRPDNTSGSWVVLAEGTEPIDDWKFIQNRMSLNAGHFLPGRAQAGVLAVEENLKTKKDSYSIRFYNPGRKQFIPFFAEKSRGYGKISGLDTLKPSDIYFCGNFGENGSPMVMWYNRDWRFDLKEIAFSDSTYHILNNIDFTGYTADHNPKYYEVLKLVPGQFTGKQCSFIVIGRNAKNKDYDGRDCSEYEDLPELPNFISLYSFKSR